MSLARAARLLRPDVKGIAEAVKLLQDGQCVAFPTETVYGLGANALREDAVLSIFRYKGRPLNDPLIVHVADAEAALNILELDERGVKLFRVLANKFWPGPLTLVSRAKAVIPSKVTAGTGFVGVRCPNHPIALELLRACGLPVAAPSANRFGHVSPTRAAHVMADLGAHPIGILDGEADVDAAGDAKPDGGAGASASGAAASSLTCAVGIESTVVKIDVAAGELLVFRRGGVSVAEIERVLSEAGEAVSVRVLSVTAKTEHAPAAVEPGAAGGASPADPLAVADPHSAGMEAPGQMLTHYAPDVPAFLVSRRCAAGATAGGGAGTGADTTSAADAEALDGAWAGLDMGPSSGAGDGSGGGGAAGELGIVSLADTVVIDFGAQLVRLKGIALAYDDLSPSGSIVEARAHVFELLRWAEAVDGAKAVLLGEPAVDDEHTDALRDRLYRAASGRRVSVSPSEPFRVERE